MVILCVGTILSVNAQESPWLRKVTVEKPALFSRMNSKVSVRTLELLNVFKLKDGAKARIYVSPDFIIDGITIFSRQVNPDLHTVQIRCTNFNGALLTMSRLKEADETYSYIGRILHTESGDCFLLEQNKEGQYFFQKEKSIDIVVE